MDALLAVVGGLAGLGLSAWVGFAVGRWCRDRRGWVYWALNAAGLAVGAAVSAVGAYLGATWLWVAGLGVMGGSLTGLKYGLGRSVGVWRVIDRATGASMPSEREGRDDR